MKKLLAFVVISFLACNSFLSQRIYGPPMNQKRIMDSLCKNGCDMKLDGDTWEVTMLDGDTTFFIHYPHGDSSDYYIHIISGKALEAMANSKTAQISYRVENPNIPLPTPLDSNSKANGLPWPSMSIIELSDGTFALKNHSRYWDEYFGYLLDDRIENRGWLLNDATNHEGYFLYFKTKSQAKVAINRWIQFNKPTLKPLK